MAKQIEKPQYFKIALDIAARIAKGELEEGKRFYGRSDMSAEYGVSSETIRRALKLLADVQIVEIKPQSCAKVASQSKAEEYIGRFGASPGVQQQSAQLKKLIAEQTALNKRIAQTAAEIAQIEKNTMISAPFPNYEIQVPANARVIGRNLGELQFWQATGATVIAIRRGGAIILSPGPYAALMEGDRVIFIGGSETVQAVSLLVSETEQE